MQRKLFFDRKEFSCLVLKVLEEKKIFC